jgi:hypothetical protein
MATPNPGVAMLFIVYKSSMTLGMIGLFGHQGIEKIRIGVNLCPTSEPFRRNRSYTEMVST